MLRLIFGVFFITFLCPTSSQSDTAGKAKIGEPCERDYHCTENAFCRAQLTCLCEPFYSPTLDGGMCIATSGLNCNTDSTCVTMTNAECRQGVCACRENFILDINNSSNCIIRPSAMGDRCQRNDECTDALDRALCINDSCQCFTSHHFVAEISKCIRSRGLYQSCEHDYECRFDKVTSDALQCRDKECVCKKEDTSTYCNGGSVSSTVITMLTMLTFVVAGTVF